MFIGQLLKGNSMGPIKKFNRGKLRNYFVQSYRRSLDCIADNYIALITISPRLELSTENILYNQCTVLLIT